MNSLKRVTRVRFAKEGNGSSVPVFLFLRTNRAGFERREDYRRANRTKRGRMKIIATDENDRSGIEAKSEIKFLSELKLYTHYSLI